MPFRLDRTAHRAGTHAENARYHARHQPATPAERLRAAAYLNSVAYGYDLKNLPRLDRSEFSARQHAQAGFEPLPADEQEQMWRKKEVRPAAPATASPKRRGRLPKAR